MNNIYLTHHGILGMKWGVRRYQNEDGSLTPAGERKQQRDNTKDLRKQLHSENKTTIKSLLKPTNNTYWENRKRYNKRVKLASKYVEKHGMTNTEALKKAKTTQIKRGMALTGTVLALSLTSLYAATRSGV